MPALDRNLPVKCTKCEKMAVKKHMARHKQSCDSGTLSCPKCPNFFTKKKEDLNYHLAKHHAPKDVKLSTVCLEEFPSFYSLQQHKRRKHGTSTKVGTKSSEKLKEVLESEELDQNNEQLQQELSACQHFFDDTEMENGRHRVFNFKLSKLDPNEINEKLKEVFEKLNFGAKVNLALGFILRNVDTNEYRYFYAHENNTFFEKSHLLCSKGDLVSLQDRVEKMDLVETCAQERENTKWRFALTTNVTIFCALLKNIPMGCIDAVLPEQLLRRPDVNCLVSNGYGETYKDYLCLFRAIAVHLYGSSELETNAANLYSAFLHESGHDAINFRGVSIDHLVFVENAIKHNIFVYDIDIEEGKFVGELARSVEMYEKNINLLRYNNHICYVDDINTFFKRFLCPSCDTFIKYVSNFNRHVKSCKDRVQHIYPKSVYALRETLFDKLDAFGISYNDDQKLFKNLAIFDFESICVPTEELKDTNTTTWIGKHEPISVSISSNLIEEPVFLCDKDPKNLIVSFVEALEELANKSKTEMQTKFASIQEIINSRVEAIFEKLNERKGRTNPAFDFEDECIEEEEADMSTQFLQMQKNQLLDLQQHFERYINTLPVFGFNSGKYDLNLIKSYLLPYLIHERDIQPTVIKKAKHFVSFKFGDVQFLDILNFLGGATSLDSFLKAYKTSESKGFFRYEWFDSPNKLDAPFLPPYECFFSKLKNHNPLEKEFTDFTKLLNSGLSQQEALKKLRLKEVPPSGVDNYNYLKVIWEEEQMSTFRDFVKWYNNKDVVPTIEAMQKMMEFYHNKGIDMLKLGCTLPNLANICLHQSTNHKIFPFVESDKDLHDKIREDMTGGPSIVFTRKAVVDQTFIRNSENICKSIVGIDASQLYPFSMYQEMPTGIYTRWELDTNSQKFKARTNKFRTFENMVMSYLQSQRPECIIESYYTTGKRKKIDCFSVDGFCAHCDTVFEAMGCYFHFCPCQEARASLSEEEMQRGIRKREHDELRRDYLRNKGYNFVEVWECKW